MLIRHGDAAIAALVVRQQILFASASYQAKQLGPVILNFNMPMSLINMQPKEQAACRIFFDIA